MDLEKNIEIAFGVYWKNLPVTTELNTGTHSDAFIAGAKSQAAKDFWYNEFKRERTPIILDEYSFFDDGILEQMKNVPIADMKTKSVNYIRECIEAYPELVDEIKSEIEVEIVRKLRSEGKCGYVSTHELTDQEKLDIEYGITPLGRQHRQYLKDNPDKPMSFDDWKYMVENYKGESSNIIHKHIGIIGHVDHGKTSIVGLGLHESQKGLIIMDMDTPLTPEERFEVMKNLKPDLSAIKSIVPIADIIPEPIISKQEFLEMHDKAVERSITEETYRESRAWDIKKEKKVSHKRNNKRK